MTNIFKTKLMQSITPYFLLAVLVIGAYKLINEIPSVIAFISYIWNIITPFFYGFLLAYILNIPSKGLQNVIDKAQFEFIRKRKKGISIIIVYLMFAGIVYFMLNLGIPYIYTSVSHFISYFIANIPDYYANIQQLFEDISAIEILGIEISIEQVLQVVRENLHLDNILNNVSANITASFNALFGLSTAIFRTFLTLISSIFILLEKDKFKAFLRRMLRAFTPAAFASSVLRYSEKLNHNFRQYIQVQTIDGMILGSLVTIELYLIGSPYFLTLGIMLGIVNYIPYFGSIFGTLIAVLVVTLTQGFTTGLLATGVLFLTQQLDGNVIQPKLMGESFKFSPLLVIISVTVGGAFAGVLGMIAAIPIVAVLKDMLEDILSHQETAK